VAGGNNKLLYQDTLQERFFLFSFDV